MKIGTTLGLLHPSQWLNVAREADRLGFESLWLPEHLVFPTAATGSPYPGEEHPPVPPTTPVYEPFAYLSYLAGQTERLRLGTNVYLLGLRHPFVAARAVATLDRVSGGRAELGIGVGWLREEWVAAGLDPRRRGRRTEEALAVCRRLWTEERIAHRGEFFEFAEVGFEPKPVQKPHPPVLIGGESNAALRRAARTGDGWMALGHSPDSLEPVLARLHAALEAEGRSSDGFEITSMADVHSHAELARLAELGVTRAIVRPWQRSRQAVEALRRFADATFDSTSPGRV